MNPEKYPMEDWTSRRTISLGVKKGRGQRVGPLANDFLQHEGSVSQPGQRRGY